MSSAVTGSLQLGAPGVYPAPAVPDLSLRPVRLDIAGFAGVAPRGPVGVPVLVRNWPEYQRRFGAFSGPGQLPFAVSAFFGQGGERAYVVRVGRPGPEPDPALDTARALLELRPGSVVQFVAADPGAWGAGLVAELSFDATRQFPLDTLPASGPGSGPADAAGEVLLPDGVSVPAGSLLRIRGTGLAATGELRWAESVSVRDTAPGRRGRVAVLDEPVPQGQLRAALVTGILRITDGDPSVPRGERFSGLGLDPRHPDFLADVVRRDSLLVAPAGDGAAHRVIPASAALAPVTSMLQRPGADLDPLVTGGSFFDERTEAGLDDETDPGAGTARLRGVTGLAQVPEIGLLCVPDLYWSFSQQAPAPDDPIATRSAQFRPCEPPPVEPVYRARSEAVPLDGRVRAELDEIVARQSQVVALADQHRRFVALLDVPPGLDLTSIASWRARFDSSYAAAYHPWLAAPVAAGAVVPPGTAPPAAHFVPPSATAAGIIAARERRLGLSWGPANELAAAAVMASATVTAAEHDILHPLGINVFRAERDGFRLTAARTLARDPQLRQLSVRRLITQIRLALDRQLQWVVFEPSTASLRELLRHCLLAFLRDYYRAGAFAGATEQESFFVRIDDALNPPSSLDLGRLTAEIGVAPAEPLEFIVVRISRDGDGGIRFQEGTS